MHFKLFCCGVLFLMSGEEHIYCGEGPCIGSSSLSKASKGLFACGPLYFFVCIVIISSVLVK